MTESIHQALDAREHRYPILVSLIREILRVYPPVSTAFTWMVEPKRSGCWEDGEYHLARLLEARKPGGLTIPALAKTFVHLCADYIKEQAYLVRHGAYRAESNDAFVDALYQDDKEMTDYMNGLFATTFTWRNHYDIFRFYRDAFLPTACGTDERTPEGVEVGPGHGLFFVLALTVQGRNARATGLDISPISLDLTAQLAQAYGVAQDRIEFVKHNVKNPLPFDDNRFSYAVSGEVLEHLDDPESLVRELRRVTRKGGRAFITTAINAAARDHVFLFRSQQELADLFARTGWTIEQQLVLEVPLPDFLRQASAVSENCAYILS